MHERECKGYISFNRGVNELNRGVNELNRGVNELNRGVNDLNRGVNHSVARQGCNLLRAAVTSAVTSQGCCCGNLQIHPLDLGQAASFGAMQCGLFWAVSFVTVQCELHGAVSGSVVCYCAVWVVFWRRHLLLCSAR